RELLEVWRDFQRLAFACAFVVNLVALQHRAGRQRNGQAEQAKSCSMFHAEDPLEFEKPACAAIRADRWRAARLRRQPRGPCRAVSSASAWCRRTGPCGTWPT